MISCLSLVTVSIENIKDELEINFSVVWNNNENATVGALLVDCIKREYSFRKNQYQRIYKNRYRNFKSKK